MSLGQYRQAFQEASIDGEFLLVLNPDECRDVLGVQHPLHSKKLHLAIDKLRPLIREEILKTVLFEDGRFCVILAGVPVATFIYPDFFHT